MKRIVMEDLMNKFEGRIGGKDFGYGKNRVIFFANPSYRTCKKWEGNGEITTIPLNILIP